VKLMKPKPSVPLNLIEARLALYDAKGLMLGKDEMKSKQYGERQRKVK